MRRLFLTVLLLLATPALAGPNDPWVVDHAKSRTEFNATQVGKIVTGRIAKWSGTIVLDPAGLAAARIDIRMDMKSVGSGTKDVDDLMLGGNFLDVQRFPEARFVSEQVTSAGGDNYQARGKLNIKRLDYGIGRNEWAATNYVADEVTIEFAVTATRPAS